MPQDSTRQEFSTTEQWQYWTNIWHKIRRNVGTMGDTYWEASCDRRTSSLTPPKRVQLGLTNRPNKQKFIWLRAYSIQCSRPTSISSLVIWPAQKKLVLHTTDSIQCFRMHFSADGTLLVQESNWNHQQYMDMLNTGPIKYLMYMNLQCLFFWSLSFKWDNIWDSLENKS
jgi:hypothetical protein